MADYGLVKGPNGLKADSEVKGEDPRDRTPKPTTTTTIQINIGMDVDDLVRAIIAAQNHNGGRVRLSFIRGPRGADGSYVLDFERVE